MYVLGVDGGGTKTQCHVADLKGNLIGEGFGGEANYQLCGIEIAEASIGNAIQNALEAANVTLEQITYAVFGLSGADEACDFEVLQPMCKRLVKDVPHEILNDTWIGLRSGGDFGVVSICGTGAAHAGVSKEGQKLILRNLDFELGNRGGGGEIVSEALHYAFRSNEETYLKTGLEDVMPSLFGVETMDQVCDVMRKDWIPSQVAYKIPIEVFRLAEEGDQVSIDIIESMGRTEGQYAAGVIKRLSMETLQVPVVLIGSLFKTDNPLLIDPYMREIHKIAPSAYKVIPDVAPVVGAVLLALDEVNHD